MLKTIVWWFVVVLVLFVGLEGSALAQDLRLLGVISAENPSVTEVMLNAGCSNAWLSQVIIDSNIDASDLRKLSATKKVKVSLRGTCDERPAAYVSRMSKRLLALKTHMGRDEATKFKEEMVKLHDFETAGATQLEALKAENAKLKAEAKTASDAAKATIAKLTAENKELLNKASVSSSTRIWQVVAGSLLLVLLAVSYWAAVWARKVWATLENVQFPQQVVVEHWGKPIIFRLRWNKATREIGYVCPFDTSHKLISSADHCEGHTRDKHPHEGQITSVDLSHKAAA